MTRPDAPFGASCARDGDRRGACLSAVRASSVLGSVLALLFLSATSLLAQQGRVGGVVQDERGAPVGGATVQVVGTSRGGLTDARGRFMIVGVPQGPQAVEARAFGHSTQRQSVSVGDGLAELTFQLRLAPLALDEVVVTGQGSEISRRRLSTNVDVISAEAIKKAPATRLDQLLQSQLPSAQIRLSSGQPGSTSLIRARGPVSASLSSTPVIYVDGVRVDNLNTQAELSLNTSGNRRQGTQTSAIADIPMESIERVEYIPGGAATTLYGSDAANGVIQIFTSKGAPGRSQFSIESEFGVEAANEDYFHFPQTVDLLYRNGLTQQYRLSGSGGSQDVTWSFSGSVHDREGFRIDNNGSRSYQARTGLAAHVAPDLQYTGSFAFGWNHYERSRDGNAGGYTPLWLLEGGRIFAFGFDNRLDQLGADEMHRLREFVNRAEALQDYRIQVARLQTSHAFRWRPQPYLSFHGTVGVDHRTSNERGIETNEFLIHTRVRPEGTDDRGTISNYDRRFLGLTLEGAGQHRLDRGALSLVTSVGAQLFRNQDDQAARIALDVRDGSKTVRGAGSTTADDFFLTLVNYGTYIQQNWGFLDRYFLEVGVRADGNSAFGDDVGLQYYPKVGLVYDLSRERLFHASLGPEMVSSFRLRSNYGVAGNFPPPFARDRTVNFTSYLGRQSAGFGQPGDPDLRPEKTETVELGADLEALDGRLSVQFSWYDARTHDALLLAPPAPSTGESVQLRNVGEIHNRGTEFRIAGDVLRTRSVNVRLRGSLNTLHNEVVDAGGTPVFGISGFSSSTVQTVVKEGWPLGSLQGNKATLGPDGTVQSVEPLAYLGKPLPDRFGTLGMVVDIRDDLTLSADADWQTGAQLHSFNRQFRFLHGLDDPAIPEATLKANRAAHWLRITNLFVEDTDYLKVRNLSALYTVPERFSTRWARGIELGATIQNPIGWWTSSFDPETDHSGATSQGAASVGGFNYASDPSPRTFLGTVRVRF